MKNPFNFEKQPHEFSVFNQLTENIDRWMTEKYPGFDVSLNGKIRRLEEIQNEIELSFRNHKKIIEQTKIQTLDFLKNQIIDFMKKDYPDMSGKLSIIAKTLQNDMKDIKTEKKELKKIIDCKIKEVDDHFLNAKIYNTLCEDVYRLRDKMEKIQEEVSEFTNKIKKAFE